MEERLAPLTLERGRRSKPDEPVTESEKQRAKGLLGSLAWLAKEGRPDVAGATSMHASRIRSMKVKDLLELNRTVEEAKKYRDQALCFYPISPEKLGCGAVTDASPGTTQRSASSTGRSSLDRLPVLWYGGSLPSSSARWAQLWQPKHSPC